MSPDESIAEPIDETAVKVSAGNENSTVETEAPLEKKFDPEEFRRMQLAVLRYQKLPQRRKRSWRFNGAGYSSKKEYNKNGYIDCFGKVHSAFDLRLKVLCGANVEEMNWKALE